MSERRTIEETPELREIGGSKCRCCEGSGWVYHPYSQDNLSFTELPRERRVVNKPTTKESTWQRIRKALRKNR